MDQQSGYILVFVPSLLIKMSILLSSGEVIFPRSNSWNENNGSNISKGAQLDYWVGDWKIRNIWQEKYVVRVEANS